MQPKYRGNGTPERTGSLSFSNTPFRVDGVAGIRQEPTPVSCPGSAVRRAPRADAR